MNKKLSLWLLFAFAWCVTADVTLDSLFKTNMVLQQEQPIAFFGTATPNAVISVQFADDTKQVISDKDGEWRAVFPAMKAGSKTYSLTVQEVHNSLKDNGIDKGEHVISLSNIIIGDVWICAGQSNMDMPIGKTFHRGWSALNCEEEVKNANYPEIRVAHQAHRMFINTINDQASYANFKEGWVPCSPQFADQFSATGYFFGRKLHQDLNIPIGLAKIAWSGTRIEPWISKEGYRAAKLTKDLEKIATYDGLIKEVMEKKDAELKADYDKKLADWQAKYDAAADDDAKKKLERSKPRMGRNDWNSPQTHCILNNGMLDVWTKIPVKGVIWYQGCSNAGNPHYYPLLKAMIADWRAKWNNPNMPFFIVQLASFNGPEDWKNAPCENAPYALTRDIQYKIADEIPNVGIITTIDIGELRNIHPANKQDVGFRLALEAERIAYGKDIVSRGPALDRTVVEGNAIRVFFKNIEHGLKTKDGQAPNAFAIAGEDKKFVWADAKLDGDTVVVSSPSVPEPKYVRYAYAAFRDDCNLVNGDNLPAFPFRSDAIDYASIK